MQTSSPAERLKGPSVVQRAARKLAADPSEFFRFAGDRLGRNGSGHLWSIDLPPPLEPELHGQIAMAVPEALRDRWTYIRGSSRRRLGPLLACIEPIELFVHDSAHTARNVLFELDHAWPALTAGGAVAVDDIDLNRGFQAFREDHPTTPTLVCHAEPIRPDPPRQDERGVFAILRKAVGLPTDFTQ